MIVPKGIAREMSAFRFRNRKEPSNRGLKLVVTTIRVSTVEALGTSTFPHTCGS